MALPTMRSGLVGREFLRIAGGYGVAQEGTSPAGGLDIDNAGNLATDGDGVMNTLQLGANIIKNSDAETTITLDVDQNVTLENDLYFNGGGNIGTDTDMDLLEISDNVLSVNGNLGIGTSSPSAALHVAEAGFAEIALFERTGATSDGLWGAAQVLATKTSNMADGFGTGFVFYIQDDAAVKNPIAVIGVLRDGADNSGMIVFRTYTTGTVTTRAVIEAGGNFGINDTTPSFKLDVNGTGQFTGKLTLGGGTDPPYVLYDLETRQSIIDRIKREVPAGKLGGAAMFFNRDTHGMETFVPSEGKFYDLAGTELASVTPITKTFAVKDKWYYDEEHDELMKFEVPENPTKHRIKVGISLDRATGEFKDTDGNVVDKADATEVVTNAVAALEGPIE